MKWLIALPVLLLAGSAHASGSWWNENLGLELGASAGTEGGMTHEAASASAELALTPHWRVHAQLARGRTFDTMDEPDIYLSARAGAEARICASEHLCVLPGLDFGFTLQASQTGLHPDEDGWVEPFHEMASDTLVVVPRLRLDVGNEHWHFRPGVEASHTPSVGRYGVAGSAAVAYTW